MRVSRLNLVTSKGIVTVDLPTSAVHDSRHLPAVLDRGRGRRRSGIRGPGVQYRYSAATR